MPPGVKQPDPASPGALFDFDRGEKDMAVSKIETQQLGKRIEELIASGITTSQGISETLKSEGHDI